jgi:hypothetical protein
LCFVLCALCFEEHTLRNPAEVINFSFYADTHHKKYIYRNTTKSN